MEHALLLLVVRDLQILNRHHHWRLSSGARLYIRPVGVKSSDCLGADALGPLFSRSPSRMPLKECGELRAFPSGDSQLARRQYRIVGMVAGFSGHHQSETIRFVFLVSLLFSLRNPKCHFSCQTSPRILGIRLPDGVILLDSAEIAMNAMLQPIVRHLVADHERDDARVALNRFN